MIVRLAVIVALATYLAPPEALERVKQSAYENSVDVVSLCERRPKDCELVAEKLKEGGIVLANFASRAAIELRARFEESMAKVRGVGDFSNLDRGTLRPEDFQPDWRGS